MQDEKNKKYVVYPFFEAIVRLDPTSYRLAGENSSNRQPRSLTGSMRRNDEATARAGQLVLDYKAPVAAPEDPLKQTLKLDNSRVTVNSQKVLFSFQMDRKEEALSNILNALLDESAAAVSFIDKAINAENV